MNEPAFARNAPIPICQSEVHSNACRSHLGTVARVLWAPWARASVAVKPCDTTTRALARDPVWQDNNSLQQGYRSSRHTVSADDQADTSITATLPRGRAKDVPSTKVTGHHLTHVWVARAGDLSLAVE